MASTAGLVDLNTRNHMGASPFFAACNMGRTKIVKFLGNKRAGDDFAVDIEVCFFGCGGKVGGGERAWRQLARRFPPILCPHLWLTLQAPDDNGITPFEIAAANGHHEVLEMLRLVRQLRVEVRRPVSRGGGGDARSRARNPPKTPPNPAAP